MVNIIMKNEIITRYRNNESQRSIARHLACSRNTVKKYVDEYLHLLQMLNTETNVGTIALLQSEICSAPRTKSQTRKKKVFTKEVKQRFIELINLDEERDKLLGKNKQKVTASLLHKTLVAEGFKVGLTTITNAYRQYQDKPKECFIKQEYPYGQRAEFDFHQIKLNVNGRNKIYHQATITLPKSDYVFGRLYIDETFNSVNDSIIQFFNHIGGITEEIVFDNMSTVVKRFLDKGKKQYTSNIRALSTYYGFKIATTNPRRGNEKGHVEVSGKKIRKNLFSLRYKFDSEDELMKYYHNQLDHLNKDNQIEYKTEKEYLNPLPAKDLLLYDIGTNKVDSYSLIRTSNNYYSVPDKYVGKTVTTHAYLDKLIVYYDNLEICQHIKKEGLKEYVLDFNHYLKTFLRKPGALKNSLALKQAPLALQTLFYEDYNMDPKGFLQFITNKEPIKKELSTIKDISINQLNTYNHLFEMGA